MDDRRKLPHWLRAWLPVAVCIGVIGLESTSLLGSDRTSAPLRWVYEGIFGPVDDARWAFLHFCIRKSGHFIGYGIVGLAWLRAWRLTLPRFRFLQDALLAVIGTALVASSDEFHQTFLPNRTGEFRDVLLDCCGAVAMQLVAYIVFRLFTPKQLAGPA
ncbi:MAG: VanZ family protein [Terracidiphilus sp.]